MKIYNAKTTFSGFKLGLKNTDKYVGIPQSVWKSGKASVQHHGITREYTEDQVETKRDFKDKFGRGDYQLWYVKWGE